MTTRSEVVQRIIFDIEDAFRDSGALVEKDILYTSNFDLCLTPLLSLPANISNSPYFSILPPLIDSAKGLPMASMYVELSVSESLTPFNPLKLQIKNNLAEALREKYAYQDAKKVSLAQAIENKSHKHIVILGDPGSGKTSLLKHICLKIAKGDSSRWLIPIFISLRKFWKIKQKQPDLTLERYAVITFIDEVDTSFSHNNFDSRKESNSYKDNIKNLQNVLEYLSGPSGSNVLFLLDGLDEIATQPDAVEVLTDEIDRLRSSFSWIVTSRRAGFFGGLSEDIRYEVVGLHDEAIESLVNNWFEHCAPSDIKSNAQNLLFQLRKN